MAYIGPDSLYVLSCHIACVTSWFKAVSNKWSVNDSLKPQSGRTIQLTKWRKKQTHKQTKTGKPGVSLILLMPRLPSSRTEGISKSSVTPFCISFFYPLKVLSPRLPKWFILLLPPLYSLHYSRKWGVAQLPGVESRTFSASSFCQIPLLNPILVLSWLSFYVVWQTSLAGKRLCRSETPHVALPSSLILNCGGLCAGLTLRFGWQSLSSASRTWKEGTKLYYVCSF